MKGIINKNILKKFEIFLQAIFFWKHGKFYTSMFSEFDTRDLVSQFTKSQWWNQNEEWETEKRKEEREGGKEDNNSKQVLKSRKENSFHLIHLGLRLKVKHFPNSLL